MAFLINAGVPEADAQMAMLATSRCTVGCVLEEQAHDHGATKNGTAGAPPIDNEAAFEAALALVLGGLVARLSKTAR
jgi:TetR/AcrR family tetracycline transcriptional repressor